MELALSRMKTIVPKLKIWGISATIGNLAQAQEVLLGPNSQHMQNSVLVKAEIQKKITVESIIPEKMETYPWRGHMGLRLLDDAVKIIRESKTTLLFVNVRSACELWFRALLEKYPEFAGDIAMHHSSISRETRHWVEDAIRNEQLKIVVCTSSLDLGVDFAPVESIIQVGGPKGVARFMQRAGRSGHQPGKESKIHFLATHAMELFEASALRRAVREKIVEDRIPYLNSWDVLIQYLNTLAVSDGFLPAEIYKEVQTTFCYQANPKTKAKVVSWMGGRMAFSAQMSELLRQELYSANHETGKSKEIIALEPLLIRQRKESIVPDANQFLIETFKTREGYHAIFYPFEGRFVHEALASLLAYRISLLSPISFSLAYNDYGFELLSDQPFSIEEVLDNNLFSTEYIHSDLEKSLNATEMAKRKFRDIAVISGLLFTGMPGKQVKTKHLQSGTQLLFEVFKEYEPDNLLLQQAYRETFEHQLEEGRLILALERILGQEVVVKECSKPTPFSFPIITDRLREKLSSETLADRIKKMVASYTKI